MKPRSKIGEKIYQRLVEIGQPPEYLAQQIETTPSRISKIMRQENIHVKTLMKISKALGVNPGYFFV